MIQIEEACFWGNPMTWLYCENCHWQQDDFWHDGYTPLDDLNSSELKSFLINGGVKTMEEWYAIEIGLESEWEYPGVDGRKFVVHRLEEAIRKIKNMRFPTEEEWFSHKRVYGVFCPVCGEKLSECMR